MGTWGYDKPPSWQKDAIQTRAGWCHPKTGIVLAACGGLPDKRRDKLDHKTSNLRTEDGWLFLMENINPDHSSNYLVLE